MFRGLLKTSIRPSIRLKMRDTQRSVSLLFDEIVAAVVDGHDLKKACENKKNILINIGCGDLGREGWINIDAVKRPGIFRWNVLNGLPLESGSVEHIHMEHFLEHLEFGSGIELLEECYRVLRPSGTIRIIVPDAGKYMNSYSVNDADFFTKLNRLGGAAEELPTKAAVCNQSFHMGGDHKFGWDFETLQFACGKVGLNNIERSELNNIEERYALDGQDWWRPLESLYVNCKKD